MIIADWIRQNGLDAQTLFNGLVTLASVFGGVDFEQDQQGY